MFASRPFEAFEAFFCCPFASFRFFPSFPESTFLCYDFGDFVSAPIQTRKWKLRKRREKAVTPPKLEGPRCGGAVTLPEISTTLSSQKSVTSPDRSGSPGGVLTEKRLRVINLELCVWRFVLMVLMHFLEGDDFCNFIKSDFTQKCLKYLSDFLPFLQRKCSDSDL